MPPQITQNEFLMKMAGLATSFLIALSYVIYRLVTRKYRYLGSGQHDENVQVQRGEVSIKDLQLGPWAVNAQKTITYAAFSLNTIILASIFIFEQRLTGYDAIMVDIMLAVSGVSVIAYFLSLQYWFLALDTGGTPAYRIRFRRIATPLQSVGWMMLLIAVLVAILTINTYIGFFFCVAAVICLIFIFEHKAELSLDQEASLALPNDFQKSIQRNIVYQYDFLKKDLRSNPKNLIRILSWNIERGYDLEKIINEIGILNPDFICLQEVDWNNIRTGDLNITEILADRLDMFAGFGVEFTEIDTPARTTRLAGGGVHGNAVFSRLRPDRIFAMDLPVCFDWENPIPKPLVDLKEKRLGCRMALISQYNLFGREFVICSTHLEDKSGGVKGRVAQFEAILATLDEKDLKGKTTIIAGDFNTFSGWQSSIFGIDLLTESMGKPWNVPEAKWWKENYLPQHNLFDPFSHKNWTHKVGPLAAFKLDWIAVKNAEIVNSGRGQAGITDHRPVWIDFLLQSTT